MPVMVVVPTLGPLFSRALGARLKMPLGSDAVAGAHGRNAREIVARVRAGGQRPADAIVGAGTGRWQVRRLADRMDRAFIDFAEVIPADDAVRAEAGAAAPAAAVALLAG